MIAEIAAAFPDRPPGVIYAFGDTIYNPAGLYLTAPIIAHEAEHGHRQQAYGAEVWWRKYIEDVEFRFDEEVQGHAQEVRAQMPRDRNQRELLMMLTVNRLLAPFYGWNGQFSRRTADTRLRESLKNLYCIA